MSYQLRKYEQNEASPFSASGNNRFSVTMGEDSGWANLTKSYLLLDCTISGPVTPYTGLVKLASGTVPGSARYQANCLISRCSFKNNNRSLEENAEINKISNSLAHFTKPKEEWEAGNYFGDGACWVQANQTLLKLPLDSLYGLGQVKAFDCSKYPNSDLYFEMEQNVPTASMLFADGSDHPRNAVLIIMENLAAAGNTLTSTTLFVSEAVAEALVKTGDSMEVNYTNQGSDYIVVATVTGVTWIGGGNTNISIQFNKQFPISTAVSCELLNNQEKMLYFDDYENTSGGSLDLNGAGGIGLFIDDNLWDSNIVVGQVVQLAFRSYSIGVTVYDIRDITITGIIDVAAAPPVPAKKRITFTPVNGINMEIVNDEELSYMTFKVSASANVTGLSVNKASLVVAKLNQEPSDKDKQDSKFYSTWKLESASTNGITDYRKQFDIDSNCVESHILHVSTGNILSTRNGIDSYRLSVNNVDTTNRDVSFDDSLYRDLIQQYIPTKKLNAEIDIADVSKCYIAPQEYNTDKVTSNVLNYVTHGAMAPNTIHCFKKVVNEL